jgi:hypothetical protein
VASSVYDRAHAPSGAGARCSENRVRSSSCRIRHNRPAAVALVCLALAVAGGACLPAAIRPTPTPVVTPTPEPTPLPPTPTPAPPTPTPGPAYVLHKVVRNDTLTSLARKYKTTGRSIAYWNRDEYPSLDPESPGYAPDDLQRGWVLRILPGEQYTPPPDSGETDEEVTPEPEDDFETEAPSGSAEASPGA